MDVQKALFGTVQYPCLIGPLNLGESAQARRELNPIFTCVRYIHCPLFDFPAIPL